MSLNSYTLLSITQNAPGLSALFTAKSVFLYKPINSADLIIFHRNLILWEEIDGGGICELMHCLWYISVPVPIFLFRFIHQACKGTCLRILCCRGGGVPHSSNISTIKKKLSLIAMIWSNNNIQFNTTSYLQDMM